MLIILYVVSFEYAEGHHDPPLVTLFAVTELDVCRHDPDGMLNDVILLLYHCIVINQYINNGRYYKMIIMLIILYVVSFEYAEGHH